MTPSVLLAALPKQGSTLTPRPAADGFAQLERRLQSNLP